MVRQSAAKTMLPASPGTAITVTNTNDSGPGSLRQAIADAAPSDTINFSVTGMIALPGFRLIIDKNLTIQGPGPSLLSIGNPPVGDVFLINNGVTASISGITIRGAGYSDVDGGSGINNRGTLTVSDIIVSNNFGYVGGGILNAVGGTMAIVNSTVSGNDALEGGGITNRGTMIITNSTISGNSASFRGGGIYNTGTTNIINSNISNNSDTGDEYFGIGGGGIFNDSGALTLSNSTVSGNTSGVGVGGILNSATLTISNCTVSGNSVGIWNISASSIETLTNTIVADSIWGATIETASHNLIGDAASSGGIVNGVNGNIVGVNPMLGPLQNNGGPTMTHALLPGSPAINAGDNALAAGATDQRGAGFSRIVRGTVDIGSFEWRSRRRPN